MNKHKISLDDVQESFNAAVKRRDCSCLIKDNDVCDGHLECSHFFPVSNTPGLRFYPGNAYAQCRIHHRKHHTDPMWKGSYHEWMAANHAVELDFMEGHSRSVLRYTEELKAEIIDLCENDRLEELKVLIEGRLQ